MALSANGILTNLADWGKKGLDEICETGLRMGGMIRLSLLLNSSLFNVFCKRFSEPLFCYCEGGKATIETIHKRTGVGIETRRISIN